MILSASHYIEKGSKKTKMYLRKDIKTFIQYGIFCFSAMIGKLLFFTYPLFALAELRLATKIIEDDPMNLDNIYIDSSNLKKIWHTIIIFVYKLTNMIIGTLIIAGITYGFSLVGELLDNRFFKHYYLLPFFIWAGAIAFIVFVLMVAANFSVSNFLIQQFDYENISEVLEQSKKLMNKKARFTLLLIVLFHIVKVLISFTLVMVLPYYIFIEIAKEGFILVMMISSLLFIMTLPGIILSYNVSTTYLFQDLLKEGYIKLELSESEIKVHSKALKEQLLKTLFNSKDISELEQKKNGKEDT